MLTDGLPFLDLSAPGFSTRSDEVMAAREAGWCARSPFGLAVLRHRQAGMLLRDRRLRQGSHAWPRIVGIEGSFARFWQDSVISREGPPHKDLRRIAQAALSNEFVLSLQGRFTDIAEHLLARLRDVPSFDFVESLSEPFAGRAITTLLGLPDTDADALAHDASRLGLAMGWDAPQHEATVNAACDRLMELAARLLDRARRGDDGESYVARMVAVAGDTDDDALKNLVVISIFGGVDTTRAQLAFAMALFADHPDQWTRLRREPDHVPRAIEEVIRTRPTTTWATREALEDFEMDGVRIRSGETLHILVHATGTDPDAVGWEAFDAFAERKLHFGFGGGAHHCLGQFVARTDMACALRVLLDAWEEVRFAGEPEYLPDSGNTSPKTMPLAPIWAA